MGAPACASWTRAWCVRPVSRSSSSSARSCLRREDLHARDGELRVARRGRGRRASCRPCRARATSRSVASSLPSRPAGRPPRGRSSSRCRPSNCFARLALASLRRAKTSSAARVPVEPLVRRPGTRRRGARSDARDHVVGPLGVRRLRGDPHRLVDDDDVPVVVDHPLGAEVRPDARVSGPRTRPLRHASERGARQVGRTPVSSSPSPPSSNSRRSRPRLWSTSVAVLVHARRLPQRTRRRTATR